MTLISQWVIRLVSGGISILPFSVIYVLSDILYIGLYKIGRYRRKVVLNNLHKSFPEKSKQEILQLTRSYYKNLCDVTLETIKGLSMSEKEIRKRFVLKNLELLFPHFEAGQSVLVMGSHLTNWEWGSMAIAPQVSVPVFGIYKKLSNPQTEAFLNRMRSKFGLRLVPMEKTARVVAKHRGQAAMYCLIADQTPSNRKKAHWVNFLNQETPFLRGTDQLARMTGYPVYYYDTRRVKRGYYEVTFIPLDLDPADNKDGTLTLAYARKLEEIIKEEPAFWLWSHRRWKSKRPEGVSMLSTIEQPNA